MIHEDDYWPLAKIIVIYTAIAMLAFYLSLSR
ncbi:hypothetical protein UFOVP235_4 [uncultured Caudovirales phage]|uniref:Uncharacterized protein n=1 Tax=uncultured Caudovirales phage TaxID=2100421 RepID=A0A6J7WVQ3_9CAUD|nr:hypothetical protein UFOVP235_4 [uncultured Caudovirales phage]